MEGSRRRRGRNSAVTAITAITAIARATAAEAGAVSGTMAARRQGRNNGSAMFAITEIAAQCNHLHVQQAREGAVGGLGGGAGLGEAVERDQQHRQRQRQLPRNKRNKVQ